MAPLESTAAVVGGECETVNSLNLSCGEAETLKLDKLFIGRVKLNGVIAIHKHGVFCVKSGPKVVKRQLFLFAGS